MLVKWLRESVSASVLMLVLRLYLGYSWLTAGWGKVTGGFDASGFINGAIEKSTGDHPAVQGWWATFLEGVALPNVEVFNVLVAWGELLVGIALILGLFTTFSALMAAIMNFSFMFSGTTSTNPQLLLLTIFILVAGVNAGRIGGDYYVIPYLKKIMKRDKKEKTITT